MLSLLSQCDDLVCSISSPDNVAMKFQLRQQPEADHVLSKVRRVTGLVWLEVER
jgi:hypothetical protein